MTERFPTSTLADVAGAACLFGRRVRAIVPARPFAGPAVPVRASSDDNGPVARAIEKAAPGDVIVVDGGGRDRVALFGGVLARRALAAGVAAVVVDGCVRDVDELAELGLPVYAIGPNPLAPSKDDRRDPADMVVCAGREIRRGDVVTGDGDGVVVIPAGDWPSVVERARAAMAKEAALVAEIGPPRRTDG